MIRVLVFLLLILAAAFGASWLADHPGTIQVNFLGQEYQTSTLVGLVALLVAAGVLIAVWTVLRFVWNVPSLMSVAARARRRQRGFQALSRGMVAVGSGDAESARRHAEEAARLLPQEPMTLLLGAQAAQLSSDRAGAESAFAAMLDHPETKVLALRGLHMEAVRRGDPAAALEHAEAAQRIATLPWAAQAVLQSRAAEGDWAGALKAVERNAGGRVTDRATANRQRAVLLTAMAQDEAERSPEEALSRLKEALNLHPTLVPAAALAGRLWAAKSDLRRATKALETAYTETPHPDLADAYVHLRHGDSALDRLARAEMLARCAPEEPETQLMLAQAALDAREFERARKEMALLVDRSDGGRPTRRACLMMADIEEAEHGDTGALLEWLQRASRAPRDKAWVADGTVSDTWAPISPSGRIGAYHWETPKEHLDADLVEREIASRRLVPRPDAHDQTVMPAQPFATAALPATETVSL